MHSAVTAQALRLPSKQRTRRFTQPADPTSFWWTPRSVSTRFRGCMQQIGDLTIPFESWDHVPNNPFFAPVADVSAALTDLFGG